jgi:hypothetical protein
VRAASEVPTTVTPPPHRFGERRTTRVRLLHKLIVEPWLDLRTLALQVLGRAVRKCETCVRLTFVDLAASGFMLAAAVRRGGCRD